MNSWFFLNQLIKSNKPVVFLDTEISFAGYCFDHMKRFSTEEQLDSHNEEHHKSVDLT